MLFDARVGRQIAVIGALVLGAVLIANSDTSPAASAGPRPVAGGAGRLRGQRSTGGYIVQPGECLEWIALRNGLSTEALAKANGLRPEAQLWVGQPLAIPTRPEPSKPAPALYTVKRGDSLWLVAKRNRTTPRAIAALNGIRSTSKLRAGQRLKLPGRAHPKAAAQPTAKPQQASNLVETALRYRGVRYRYAGTTTRGMDCSGLVSRVLNSNGIAAPHNSRALYRLGKSVAKASLRSGDLVFFSTRGRGISHVGIYIGDGKFVHASSGQGRVRVDTLMDGYYSRRYVGARRVS